MLIVADVKVTVQNGQLVNFACGSTGFSTTLTQDNHCVVTSLTPTTSGTAGVRLAQPPFIQSAYFGNILDGLERSVRTTQEERQRTWDFLSAYKTR
ncbi:MAG: hypothetical protein AAB515_03110 [Patescibacteria group bacterium]